ncbi:hypothetical protein L1049_027083 [Liquidambar formosana]|uniref:Uncharacterized protein n=1 Tax=Liquidambar formosana TaxID=63359 RepID=A0AAP0N660_LIQFO
METSFDNENVPILDRRRRRLRGRFQLYLNKSSEVHEVLRCLSSSKDINPDNADIHGGREKEMVAWSRRIIQIGHWMLMLDGEFEQLSILSSTLSRTLWAKMVLRSTGKGRLTMAG